MKQIYFIRHGLTDANVDRYFGGPEESLNADGEAQARLVGERVANLKIDILLDSGWKRATQTADIINGYLHTERKVIPELGEHNFPTSLINQPYTSESGQAYASVSRDNWDNPEYRYEDDEIFADMFKRSDTLRTILEELSEQNIAAVTHSRFLRFFTGYMLLREHFTPAADLQMSIVLKPANTGVTLFTYDEGVWKLQTWNDQAHFAE